MAQIEQYELIARRLGELHKHMKQTQGKILEKYNITLLEYHILMVIWKNNSASQNDLAKMLDVDKALISRQITNMETKGLIFSDYDPNCKRKKILLLSDASQKLIPQLQKSHKEGLENTFSDLSDKELKEFQQIIEGLVKKL